VGKELLVDEATARAMIEAHFDASCSGADTDNYAQSSVYQQCAAPGHAMRILV